VSAGAETIPSLRIVEPDGAAWPDLDVFADEDAPPRLSEGEYVARVVHIKIFDKFFKVGRDTKTTDRLILMFRIVEGPHAGTDVPFYVPMPKSASKRRNPGRYVPAQSKFWRAWTIANGAPPKRHDRMALSVFRNRLFLVQIRDVIKDRGQNRLGDVVRHSVIEAIVERIA
jgi:hypothetical protein